jgi:hypothetical protein
VSFLRLVCLAIAGLLLPTGALLALHSGEIAGALLVAGFVAVAFLVLNRVAGWRAISAASLAMFCGSIVGVFLYTPLLPNLGLPLGYYGKFNRVMHALSGCSGVSISHVGMHRDFALEDFWIDVRIPSGESRRLAFDNANIRSYADLESKLGAIGCL